MVRQKNDHRKKCDQDNRQQKYMLSRKEPKKFGWVDKKISFHLATGLYRETVHVKCVS